MFWQKGFGKVVADVDLRNEASVKLLNKIGFVETDGARIRTRVILGSTIMYTWRC